MSLYMDGIEIKPFISKMIIDEDRKLVLSNFNNVKSGGVVTESDHNVEILELNLVLQKNKPERLEIFKFSDESSQANFKFLTSNTEDFTNCFENDLDFESQIRLWRKTFKDYLHKSFKKSEN